MFEKRCKFCGKIYFTRFKNSKYCSSKCSQEDRKTGKIKICPICNKTFYICTSKNKQTFCSYQCKAKAQKQINKIFIYEDRAEIEIITKKYGIKYAIIDLEDIEKIKIYKWCVKTHNGNIFYVSASKNCKENISLHRLVMNCPKNLCVHHINHNPLDNRKSNLKICTTKENSQDVITTKNKTGYQNIHPHRNKFRVKITRNGKDIIKIVNTLDEAIKVRNEILLKL